MNIEKIVTYIKQPKKILLRISGFQIFSILRDRQYLLLKFKLFFNRKIDFVDPIYFNEKLQWLKLYDRKPIYTTMADKYEAKKYVANIIGEEYIIPTLGVWDRFEDIDFDSLPNQFVLKCTHDSGGLVICKDKSSFNKEKAKLKINSCLKKNFYWVGREWPYKNIKPRIIAEQYIENKQLGYLIDYKFHCFNGEPKYLYISSANFENGNKNDVLTHLNMDFSISPFQRIDHDRYPKEIVKPLCFNRMVDIVKKLSKEIPFVRIDLYCVNNQIYFSEFTFYPGSGFFEYYPKEYNKIIGDWLTLPTKK